MKQKTHPIKKSSDSTSRDLITQPPQTEPLTATEVSSDNTFETQIPLTPKMPKSRNIYVLIASFAGLMGFHNFYITRYQTAFIQLLFFFSGIMLPVNIFWILVDMLTVKTDGNNQPLTPLNEWGKIIIFIYGMILILVGVALVFAVKVITGLVELSLIQ